MSPNTMKEPVACVPGGRKLHLAKIGKRFLKATPYFLLAINILVGTYCPAFAATGAEGTIKDLLKYFVNLVCMGFSGVGIVIVAFSIGKAILAFKNEDTDGQARAAMAIMVGLFLVAIGPIVNGFNLIDKLYTF